MADENEQIVAAGEYVADGGRVVRIGPALRAAAEGTVDYTPAELDALLNSREGGGDHATSFEVTAEGTMQAAGRLHREGAGSIAALNFASARNPGGGYIRGAKAQEEDLCRSALLYSCLLKAPDYYETHRASSDLLYSHRVIWSPDVPVVRNEGGRLLDEFRLVSFLTSPAPNAGEALRRDRVLGDRIVQVLHERAERVLAVAAHQRVRTLILGAWGCGVFRNDPRQVADAFHAHLVGPGAFTGAFERVVFAVWDRSPVSANKAAFAERFGEG
ncbi:TIGR02452 family protein [Actinomadura sp. PM05-2]|uniref:TIGR02452 family protein n=1 Tax=Actinomadura parmotrematis TaxID=2864039 RepID=A0ABS7G4F0_9ACTN|nr:TIGR02452 family protein [Actinomadura parmotrematis]